MTNPPPSAYGYARCRIRSKAWKSGWWTVIAGSTTNGSPAPAAEESSRHLRRTDSWRERPARSARQKILLWRSPGFARNHWACCRNRTASPVCNCRRGPGTAVDALVVGTAKYCEQTPELGMRRKPAGDLLQRVFRIPAIIIRETDNVAARQAQSRISVPARLRVSNAGAEFSAAHAGAARDLIGRRGSGQP